MPQKAIVRLSASEPETFAVLGTLDLCDPAVLTYNLNSMFDPFSATGTTQPHYFDQWSIFFTNYRVLRCDYVVSAYMDGAQTDINSDRFLTVFISEASTAPTNINLTHEAWENKRMRMKSLRVKGGTNRTAVIRGSVKITNYVTAADDSVLEASFGANPAQLIKLYIGYANAYGAAAMSTGSIKVSTSLKFTALLSEPKVIGGS